jgi:signal transduction histidine kinase/DNA-binding response OmpR family regulator
LTDSKHTMPVERNPLQSRNDRKPDQEELHTEQTATSGKTGAMSTFLRVLIVDESQDYALLLTRKLRRSGYAPEFSRVDTPEAMKAALAAKEWDVVVSDLVMPSFNGLDALRIVKENGLDLPFIIVSDKIEEESIVEVMRAGAHDFIVKENLVRLALAVKREITEAEVRRERRQAWEELKWWESELKEAQRLAKVGSWEWAEKTGTVVWSEELYRIAGRDPKLPPAGYGELTGMCTPESMAQLGEAVEKALRTGESYELDLELVRPDGTRRWVIARGEAKYDENGHVAGLRGTVQDINDRKRQEEGLRKQLDQVEDLVKQRTMELRMERVKLGQNREALLRIVENLNRKTGELELANVKLMEVDRLKSMFIASMSHELRTPLNSIINFSNVLYDEWLGPVNAEQKENLANIQNAGGHLLNLINDVIDVTKIEAGKMEAFVSEFCLSDMVEEAVNLIMEKIDEKKLKLRTKLVNMQMLTDRRRLLQCLNNFLSNAVKFTEKGSITVETRTFSEGCVEISVIDTGIGIKEDEMAKLFQPFVRLVSPIQATIPGTGLGLYITKKLAVEILKGDVFVASECGKGSRFTLRMPANLP